MIAPHRSHPLWFAFILHRISGLVLALFLPIHFYVLALVLKDASALDGFLIWAENPLVKIAEIGLVFLLAVHFFGGLRLLALEFLPWSPRQKTYASLVISASFILSCIFLLNLV
ncbi:MAG: succinate dehydrogenase, cytochrome b556 subunit [Rhizobiaceae bacterium]